MSSTFIKLPLKNTGNGISSISSVSSELIVTNGAGPNASISFDDSNLAAQHASSVTNTYTAGEDMSALKAVYYDPMTDSVYLGNYSTLEEATVIGITMAAVNSGQPVEVFQYGLLEDPFFNFTQASIITLGTSGSVTDVIPGSGYLCRLGRAITEDSILVLIETPIQL